MKLWVDDLRPAPPGWVWVKHASEAIDILPKTDVSDIALDHDLGFDETTRSVVLFMAERNIWPRVHILTANPVGRAWIEGMVQTYGN